MAISAMDPTKTILLSALVGAVAVGVPSLSAHAAPAVLDFRQDVAGSLMRLCGGCHGGHETKGDLDLVSHIDGDPLPNAAALQMWQDVATRLKAGEMPPPSEPQPTADEREKILAWVEASLSRAFTAADPGRVLAHRLSKVDYENTIRDLFALKLPRAATERFPDDPTGEGFDNQGDVLTMPPLLVERYLAAAEVVAQAAVPPQGPCSIPLPAAGDNARVVEDVLHELVPRAYRRPVTQDEVDRLVAFGKAALQAGKDVRGALRDALTAMLVSPHFLLRIERQATAEGAVQALDDHALASRLSYFLWRSMPDERLFALAREHRLHDPKVLRLEVTRMLADPRAQSLSQDFGMLWLQTRPVLRAPRFKRQFPNFEPALASDMLTETRLFVDAVVRENLPIRTFIDADFTYLNERLAKHYGVPGVQGDGWRKVAITSPERRGGLVTQASMLTVTSNPNRTSPVKRGLWILEQILGSPPPPPPPNTPQLERRRDNPLSLREQIERHRADPACASCHRRMDPLGFGLEVFDAIGSHRADDRGKPIDARGELPDGAKFNGPAELRTVLLKHLPEFRRNLSERLLTYALRRRVTLADRVFVQNIAKATEADHDRFGALVQAVVLSEPFMKRRAEPNAANVVGVAP
ncbi:MAG: DUF1592 domain-containing protein [Deltaproteobacteria bacterium]|nr:DUF1592 domain-containing protein [Deltaproteobacteria bacterium]